MTPSAAKLPILSQAQANQRWLTNQTLLKITTPSGNVFLAEPFAIGEDSYDVGVRFVARIEKLEGTRTTPPDEQPSSIQPQK